MKQFEFQKTNWKHRYSHGGTLRKVRAGRGARPLSTREPVHLVFKANKARIRSGLRTYKRYFLIQKLLDRYSKKFFVRIEQASIQNDHIHLLIRTTKRSKFQSFFRVVAGQIAQQFQQKNLVTDTPEVRHEPPNRRPNHQQKLWQHRPFTRVVRGWKNYQTAKAYIQLNEQEALGQMPYRKTRLRGLNQDEWEALWA